MGRSANKRRPMQTKGKIMENQKERAGWIVAGPETGGNVKWQYFKFICVTISGSFRSIDRLSASIKSEVRLLENRRADTNTRGGLRRGRNVTRKAAGESLDEERNRGKEGNEMEIIKRKTRGGYS